MDCKPTAHIFLCMAKLGLSEYENLEILSEIPQKAPNLDFGIKFSTDEAPNGIFVANML